jgi:ACS family D-galactonate transporter-like MFS transporter
MGDLTRPTKLRWLIVFLLAGLVFLAHFNRVSISVAGTAEFIGEGKLSKEQMGLVYSTFLIVYSIGMLPGGWVIDRIGPRRAMAGMGLGFGFWAALTGVLGWTNLSIVAMFAPLLLIRGIAGAFSVPLHPGAARAVSLWTPLRERSTANGLITAGALLGIALCYPCFGWLIDHIGWPVAFVGCGVTLMLFAALWWMLSADDPASHRWTNAAERDLVAHESSPARARTTLREVLRLFTNRSLVLLTLSYGAVGYIQYLFFYWIEYYFSKVLKVEPEASRWSTFAILTAMAVGMALGGWVSDALCRRLGQRWGCRLIALTGMGLCAAFSLLGLTTADPAIITLFFSLSFAALGLCEGIFWTSAPALEPRSGGLACALINTGGNGFGFLAPVLTPIISDYFGWSAAIVVASAVCFIGAALWLGIDRRDSPRPATR